MASAPAPSASISANGSFCAPSLTRPLEPTQIAPDFSTIGSNAAARPPVTGSFGFPRVTRFETTTRFTIAPLYVCPAELTAVHHYGSRRHGCNEYVKRGDALILLVKRRFKHSRLCRRRADAPAIRGRRAAR